MQGFHASLNADLLLVPEEFGGREVRQEFELKKAHLSRVSGNPESSDGFCNKRLAMGGVLCDRAVHRMFTNIVADKAFKRGGGHQKRAAGIASLPFHPVGFLRSGNRFPLAGCGSMALRLGFEKVALHSLHLPEIRVKTDVTEFMRQGRPEAILVARVF